MVGHSFGCGGFCGCGVVVDCSGGVSFFVGAVYGGVVVGSVVVGVGEGDGGGSVYFGGGGVECGGGW